MNSGARFRQVRSVKLRGAGVFGLLVFGLLTLVGILLTSVVLSLLLAPLRFFLARVRRRPPVVEEKAESSRTGTDPAWQPNAAIEGRYEEVS